MSNEAVLSAVSAVEEGGADADHPGDPTGADLDEQAAPDLPGEPEPEQGGGVFGIDVGEWALSVPEGSHRDFDAREWWDPEGGGENRLAFHLSALSDEGAGYPNLPGAIVGLAELYYRRVVGVEADPGGEPEPEQDGEPQETATRAEAEALV